MTKKGNRAKKGQQVMSRRSASENVQDDDSEKSEMFDKQTRPRTRSEMRKQGLKKLDTDDDLEIDFDDDREEFVEWKKEKKNLMKKKSKDDDDELNGVEEPEPKQNIRRTYGREYGGRNSLNTRFDGFIESEEDDEEIMKLYEKMQNIESNGRDENLKFKKKSESKLKDESRVFDDGLRELHRALSTLKFEPIDEKSFMKWSFRVRMNLRGLYVDCFLDSKIANIMLSSTFIKNYPTASLQDCERVSHRLSTSLLSALPDSKLELFMFEQISNTTPCDIWKKYQSAFVQDKLEHRAALRVEFETIKLSGYASVKDYAFRVQSLANELNGLGATVDNEYLMHRLFAGLTDDYRPIIGVLRAQLDRITFESAVIQLDQFLKFGETFDKVGGVSANHVSKVWNGPQLSPGSNFLTCFNCGLRGHKKETCTNPPRPRIDTRICHNCQAQGHVARNCTKARVQRCLACDEIGHVKSICPVLKRAGHVTKRLQASGNAAETTTDGTTDFSPTMNNDDDARIQEIVESYLAARQTEFSEMEYSAEMVTAEGVDENQNDLPIVEYAHGYSATEECVGRSSMWLIDSGASHHMCFDRSLFVSIRDLTNPAQVKVANNQFVPCSEIGDINLPLTIRHDPKDVSTFVTCVYKLKNVLFVPGIRKNLLSVGSELRMAPQGCVFVADQAGNCCMRTLDGTSLYTGSIIPGSNTTWALDLSLFPQKGTKRI